MVIGDIDQICNYVIPHAFPRHFRRRCEVEIIGLGLICRYKSVEAFFYGYLSLLISISLVNLKLSEHTFQFLVHSLISWMTLYHGYTFDNK